MRKDVIIEVAIKKFSQRGDNLSLSEVAKESGIRKQTLYNYFKDKDDLLFSIISMETKKYFDEKRIEFDNYINLNLEQQLYKMFISILTYFSDKEKLLFWRWIILIESEDLKSKCSSIIRDKEKNFSKLLNDAFKKGIECGDIKNQPIQPMIQAYIVLIHGTLDGQLLFGKKIEEEPFVNNVWNIYWNGIKSAKGNTTTI